MNDIGLSKRLMLGAVAGLAGTSMLQGLRTASQRYLPATMPPIRMEPGAFMVEKVERTVPNRIAARTPALAEQAAAKLLAIGYGLTAGTLYAASRPGQTETSLLTDGLVIGVGTWAAGYLGWLPGFGLMAPVSQQGLKEALGPVGRHVLFGIVTAATYRKLRRMA
jgi:hypothetical protein